MMHEYLKTVVDLAILYTPKVILAIIVLFVGLKIIKGLCRLTDVAMERANLDKSLLKFVHSLLSMVLKALLFISVASMVGIATTSFVAILGAAGLAIGLALQGSLANFAGGVLILLFKPFQVGDFIETGDYYGKVMEIQIFNTIIKTLDTRTIVIPNSSLSTNSLINHSTEKKRRVDLPFGIGYGDDILKARSVIEAVAKKNPLILQDPAPRVVVTEHGESSVNLSAWTWCEPDNYWEVFFYMQENVKLAFDKEGISIPFPQRDVHIIRDE
ncbi:MAG: mechanosensitive ion channel [bacterium]|nr:mechanosensitive ion channel [bacterium]